MAYDNTGEVKASLQRKIGKTGKEYFSGCVTLCGQKLWITEFENEDKNDPTLKYKSLIFKPADPSRGGVPF